MSEASILKKIMLRLGSMPKYRIWRNNTGMLWNGKEVIKINSHKVMKLGPGDMVLKEAYPVKFGLSGSADIIGIKAKEGRFIAIEVKDKKGKQSKFQRNFEAMVKSMGGIYVVARSEEEAINKLGEYENE